MKPKDLSDWVSDENATGIDAPNNQSMGMCKQLIGKKICHKNPQKVIAAFQAKKAQFIALRMKKLGEYKTHADKYVANMKTLVMVTSDMVAETASAAMLMARLFMNGFERYGCKFNDMGTFDN
jgi:hypothetical protein